jgi:hypothetical protein
MEPSFEIIDTLRVFPGKSAWYYLQTSESLYKKIKQFEEGPRRGFGSMRVRVQINKSIWTTSIFPTKDKIYLLFIKAEIRKTEQLKVNQKVRAIITLI